MNDDEAAGFLFGFITASVGFFLIWVLSSWLPEDSCESNYNVYDCEWVTQPSTDKD